MRSSYPQWLHNVLDYILDNVFDILTLGTAGYVITRHQLRPYTMNDIADLATWILAVLGFIALSGVWHQHRRLTAIEKLGKKTYDLIQSRLSDQVVSDHFFWPGDKSLATQDFALADDICLVGITLRRMVNSQMAIFRERLERGANLRFIILDPTNESLMQLATAQSYGSQPFTALQSLINLVVADIEDIPTANQVKGTLKVGYLPYFPSFGMRLIDPDKPNGQIHIKMYHHRTPHRAPTFSLYADKDSYWYEFFRQQFDLLWDSCEQEGKVIDLIPGK